MKRAAILLLGFLGLSPVAGAAPAGACVTAHPVATRACADVLAAGGNAFDAAVTASATLGVVEPFGSGLGGGGFFLLHHADDERDVFLDGRERAPLAATADLYLDASGKVDPKASLNGAKAAAVPHQPALLATTAADYGRKPLATVLQPAIRAAREGIIVDSRLAKEIATHAPRMNETALAVFAPGGVPLPAGALLRQPALADTLERFARNGLEEFRTGETAQRELAAVSAGGGIWHADDLLRAQTTEREPLTGYFREYRIVTAPPPSAGGATILEALTMLEARGYTRLDSLESKRLVIEALRRAYRDRNRWFGDPDFVNVPLVHLLSRSYLLSLAASIGERATPSRDLPADSAGTEGGQTTHFSVVDTDGNRVAGTQSLNLFFGSGFMAPGTGVMLNDEMDDFAAAVNVSNVYGLAGSKANAIAPGKRPLSSMSPTFVEGPRGVLITGTPGGSRIPSMVLLAALRFTDGANAAQIAATPRFHHQWLPDEVQFEPGALTADEQTTLRAKGYTLKALLEPYGNLQVIIRNRADGQPDAAADPRWVGAAQVVPATP